jgi:hypothetical protein
MKTRVTKNSITFTGIANESQMEMVNEAVEQTLCNVVWSECSTKAVITGNLPKFIDYWNNH